MRLNNIYILKTKSLVDGKWTYWNGSFWGFFNEAFGFEQGLAIKQKENLQNLINEEIIIIPLVQEIADEIII
jgi:hypothetical protein